MRKVICCMILCLAGTLVGCSTDEDFAVTQNKAIETYLKGQQMKYVIQGGTYRYISNEIRQERATEPIAQRGSQLEVNFAAYTFTSIPGTLIYSNMPDIASQVEGLNTTHWDLTPLTIGLGSASLIQGVDLGLEGCHQGDSVSLFFPSELAYGEKKLVGVVPANSAMMWKVVLNKVVN